MGIAKFTSLLLCALLVCKEVPMRSQSSFTAEDFTATDLNGQVWNLYSLLDAGQVVVLHFMSTHSLPAWAYHQGKSLHTFYQQQGPSGANRARVFLLESDSTTNVSCLYGAAGCNGSTWGNWVAGTPFPILNDHSIAGLYGIMGLPSIVLICPNRKAHVLRPMPAAELAQHAEDCSVAFGQYNAAIGSLHTGMPWLEVCSPVALTPRATLLNLGQKPLTQAVLQLLWNDSLVGALSWQGHLGTYEEVPVNFPVFEIDKGGTLEARIYSFNAGAAADEDLSNNTRVLAFEPAPRAPGEVFLLKIRTDAFGEETYWELRNAAGQVLRRGGNQAVGPQGGGRGVTPNGGPGAYGSNVTIHDTLYLPEPGCYSLYFVDAYGDGMCCTHGQGYFQLFRLLPNSSDLVLSGGSFGAYEYRRFNTDGSVSTHLSEGEAAAAVRLWPNPTSGVLMLEVTWPHSEMVSAQVVDAFGRLMGGPQWLHPRAKVRERVAVDAVQHLSSGVYWLCLRGAGGVVMEKFAVSR